MNTGNIKILFVKNASLIVFILLTVTVLSILQFSYDKLQQDDYFHIRYSQMVRQNGIYRQFPWLKYTILNENFCDNKLLYHLLLIPFTFGNLITTGKIAAIFFATALGVFFYWFLVRYGVKYPLFWSLILMFGSNSFLVRSLTIRPITLGIIFFILGVHLLLQKKYIWLAVLNYLFVLTYGTFILFLVITVVYTISYLFYYKKFEARPIIYTLAGIIGGLVVNPYFPKNVIILSAAFLKGTLVRSNLEPNLEWLPLPSWRLFTISWAVLSVFIVVIFLSLRKKREHSFPTIFLFIQAAVFLLLFFKVSRGVDQFVPFAVLFSAFAFSELDIKISKKIVPLLFILPAIALGLNFNHSRRSFQRINKIDNKGSALWLKENTPEGSLVFISNYGAFPQLFFYNQNNTYSHGLDPNLMNEYDEKLYNEYQDAIWLRKNPYPIIKGEFRAQYIHVENIGRTRNFYNYLNENPHPYRKVYEDDFSAVFELRRRR